MGFLSKGGNGMGEHDERVEGRGEYEGDGEAIGMYVEDSGLTLKRCLGTGESEKNGSFFPRGSTGAGPFNMPNWVTGQARQLPEKAQTFIKLG